MNEEFINWPRPIPSRIAADGWSADWHRWFDRAPAPPPDRSIQIEREVRRALTVLSTVELTVIESYYFDARSLSQISDHLGLSLSRVTTLYRRVLGHLEQILAPFVYTTFGLSSAREITCPICVAPWRRQAEELLDTRTPEATWGQMIARIERATGWRASTPQVLISHHRKHRQFHQTDATPTQDSHSIFKEDQ